MAYKKPPLDKIPFNFDSTTGYSAPDLNNIKFNFKTLNSLTSTMSSSIVGTTRDTRTSYNNIPSMIEGFPLYINEAHTYLKYCDNIAILYGDEIQFIKGRCYYGGIRDLTSFIQTNRFRPGQADFPAFIQAITSLSMTVDFPVVIKPIHKDNKNLSGYLKQFNTDVKYITSNIDTHQPSDLFINIQGQLRKGSNDIYAYLKSAKRSHLDLSSSISYHEPQDLSTTIGGHLYGSMSAVLVGEKRKGSDYIYSSIKTHTPSYLKFIIKAINKDVSDLLFGIEGKKKTGHNQIGSVIGTHRFAELSAQVRVVGREAPMDLPGSIIGKKKTGLGNIDTRIQTHRPIDIISIILGVKSGTSDFISFIRGMVINNVRSEIEAHRPSDLRVLTKGIGKGIEGIYQDIYGWDTFDLASDISYHLPKNISSSVSVHKPSNVRAWIKGWVIESSKEVSANIHGWQELDIHQVIGTHKPVDIRSLIKGWVYGATRNIIGDIHGWQEFDISSVIKLHKPDNLRFFIKGRVIEEPTDFPGYVHGWQEAFMPGRILAFKPANIKFIIRGWARNVEDTLPGSVHGWVEAYLKNKIDIHKPGNLEVHVFVHEAPKIYSIIKGWVYGVKEELPTNIYGWQDLNIKSFIGGHVALDIRSMIKVYSLVEEFDLLSNIHGWQETNIASSIKYHNPSNINSAIAAIKSVITDFPGHIYGWQDYDLSSYTAGHLPLDIKAIVHSWQEADIKSNIKLHSPIDIKSNIKLHAPADLIMYVRVMTVGQDNLTTILNGILHKSTGGIRSTIGTHSHVNLTSIVTQIFHGTLDLLSEITIKLRSADVDFPALISTHGPVNLYAFLRQTYGQSSIITSDIFGKRRTLTSNITSQVDKHSPVNLDVYAKSNQRQIVNLYIAILGDKLKGFGNIGSTIDKHIWSNISSFLVTALRNERDLNIYINGKVDANLLAFIRSMHYDSIHSNIYPIPGVDINSYLRVRPQSLLFSSVHGYGKLDLGSYLKPNWKSDIASYVGTHKAVSINSMLKGRVIEANRNILANLIGLTYTNILSYIRCTYLATIPAYLFAIKPIDIMSLIHSWQSLDLNVGVEPKNYPYNLSVYIKTNRNLSDLIAKVNPVVGSNLINNLRMNIKAYHVNNLKSNLGIIPAINLGSNINIKGEIRDIHAEIHPKYIRIITILPVVTMSHYDLSAIINSSCRESSFRLIFSSIRSIYDRDISSYIRGVLESPYSRNLSSSIGYSNYYYAIDKLKLNIRIKNDWYIAQNKIGLYIKLFSGASYMQSYINPVMRTSNLGVSIYGDWLWPYEFEHTYNRERVYSIKDGMYKESFEVVELSFKDVVKDYLFCMAVGKVYKIDRMDKWVLNASSYIPRNDKLNIKRKFSKSKTLHKINRFKTVDEAVKYLINEVTMRKIKDLKSHIKISGGIKLLNCKIRPREGKGSSGINCNINPLTTRMFFRLPNNNIEKID